MTPEERQQISDDERRLRAYGAEENQWVRARILKQDPPPEGLLAAVERACRMAANSFGVQDPIYGEALVNRTLCYDVAENDEAKAAACLVEARTVLGENSVEVATGLYLSGLFHFQARHDLEKAERLIVQSLAMFKQCLGDGSRPVADCLDVPAKRVGLDVESHGDTQIAPAEFNEESPVVPRPNR